MAIRTKTEELGKSADGQPDAVIAGHPRWHIFGVKGDKSMRSGLQTPVWTLIGVAIGFILSFTYQMIQESRARRKNKVVAIERAKKLMHVAESEAIKRLLDALPQFSEDDQIDILCEVAQESALNKVDRLTETIIEELGWLCILYEVDSEDMKRSRTDRKKSQKIVEVLHGISNDVVEYRQAEHLVKASFDLVQVLLKHSLSKGYQPVVGAIIRLYHATGLLSVGAEYASSGYRFLGFTYGIETSLQSLGRLRTLIEDSSLNKKAKILLTREAEKAAINIRLEHDRRK